MDLIEISRGRTRVTVAPAYGGRIAQITVADSRDWTPLLFEPPQRIDARDPLAWGSYVLAPWPNRIAGGVFTFRGETYRVPVNNNGNALHGFGYTRPWRVDDVTGDDCLLSLEMPPEWPFGGRVEQRIEAFDDGVRQRVTLHADAAAYPCGVGWHPWFRRDVLPHAGMQLLIEAGARYELDAMIPTGRIVPVAGDWDFREYPAVGGRSLDDCWRGVQGPLCVRWGALELVMTSTPNAAHAVIYSQHPDAVCVEPQTCAIDAFNLAARGDSGAGMQIASPGAPFVAETEWRWREIG